MIYRSQDHPPEEKKKWLKGGTLVLITPRNRQNKDAFFKPENPNVGVAQIKQEGLRRFWSMCPLARVPFWYRSFEPQPCGSRHFESHTKIRVFASQIGSSKIARDHFWASPKHQKWLKRKSHEQPPPPSLNCCLSLCRFNS